MSTYTEPHEIWQTRWQALDKTMSQMLDQFTGEEFDRKDTLLSLLRSLKAFARSQFEFFYKGFYDSAEGPPRLETSTQYPPAYVFRTTLDQIAFDMAVLEKAQNQRRIRRGNPGVNQAEREALARADILACRVLRPAITEGLLQELTALTYFQKASSVRVIPYAPVALIGVPYSCVINGESDENARDYLAIPHEIGHYVFWHGQVNGERLQMKLRNRLNAQSDWAYRWLEEIFADVYGCIIAGPVMGLNFQDLQLDNLPDEFSQDDGAHPVPTLRPNIYSHTVKRMNMGRATGALEETWQEALRQRGAPATFWPRVSRSGEGSRQVKLSEAIEEITPIIDTILDNELSTLRSGSHGAWTGELEEDRKVADLYESFVAYVKELSPSVTQGTSIEVPELGPEQVNGEPSNTHVLVGTGEPWEIGETKSWVDLLKTLTPELSSRMPPEIWSVVLSTHGWTTGGPEGDQFPK